MAAPSKPSSAAQIAILYITIGALMVVWSGVWYFYLNENQPDSRRPYFWITGLMLSGLTLTVIGLAVGRIGRSAKHAELPPEPSPAQRPLPVPPAQGTVPPQPPAAQVVANYPPAGTTPVGANQAGRPSGAV
jgi:hypothetical protein